MQSQWLNEIANLGEFSFPAFSFLTNTCTCSMLWIILTQHDFYALFSLLKSSLVKLITLTWNLFPGSQSYSFTAHWGQIMNNGNINWSKLLINAWPGRLPSSWPFGSFGLSIMRIWSKNWYHHFLFPLPSCYKILYSIAIIMMNRGNNAAACYLIIL